MRYKQSQADPCLYFAWVENALIILVAWVDDIVIIGPPAIRAPVERVLCTLIVPSFALLTILYLYILRRMISKNHRSVRIFVSINGVPKGP
jgi:hypothetical protein